MTPLKPDGRTGGKAAVDGTENPPQLFTNRWHFPLKEPIVPKKTEFSPWIARYDAENSN